jgi:hypothetical protein
MRTFEIQNKLIKISIQIYDRIVIKKIPLWGGDFLDRTILKCEQIILKLNK